MLHTLLLQYNLGLPTGLLPATTISTILAALSSLALITCPYHWSLPCLNLDSAQIHLFVIYHDFQWSQALGSLFIFSLKKLESMS